MIYTSNIKFNALVHFPFSDLQWDQYSLSHCENLVILAQFSALFHSESTNIDRIAHRITGDKRGHQIGYFTHRLCCDKITIQILNLTESCKTHKMELRSGSNPASNLVVLHAVQVTTWTRASGQVPNPACSRRPWNHC